jgi:hypothetical protein
MSASNNGKAWLMIVILLLLAGSVFYDFYSRTMPLRAKVTAVKSQKTGIGGSDEVLLDRLLGRHVAEFSSVHRNVFEFGSSATPVVEESALMESPEVPVATNQPELPDVRYLAFYAEKDPKGIPIAAIINGGQIFVGVEGDILAGKYKVLQIDEEFIVLRFLPDNRVLRLPLGKEAGVLVQGNESALNR